MVISILEARDARFTLSAHRECVTLTMFFWDQRFPTTDVRLAAGEADALADMLKARAGELRARDMLATMVGGHG
jgi:hypothetical protein